MKSTLKQIPNFLLSQEFPSLVFFKEGVPNLYDGDMNAEEEVLDWLIEMKVDSHIEHITRPMLEVMVVEVQYLAVFFCKFFYLRGCS